jgi:hypothetical protein
MRKLTLVLCLGLLASVGCRPGDEPPVARVVASPAVLELDYGRMEPLELRWEMLAPLAEGEEGPEPLVFVHLIDEREGRLPRRTFDHRFPSGWEPGRTVTHTVHLYNSAIAPAIAPGEYRLRVGLYDGSERRWPLAAERGDSQRRHYDVATVRSRVPESSSPRFHFSGEWLPAEPGGDRQTVARRWLTGAGGIEISDLPSTGGRLWMMLFLPEAVEGTRLVLEKGDAPSLGISADCSGFEAHLVGTGVRELSIPTPADVETCTVTLEPGHHVIELETLRRLAVSLEQLAWQEGG